MNTIVTSLSGIEELKSRMLHHVVEGFARPNQGGTQRSISVWRWSNELPFPKQDNIRVNGGCLNFEVFAGKESKNSEVFFSVWYMAGEVRFGVRVPTALLGQSGMRNVADKIAKAYDGSECARRSVATDNTFFDWIFRGECFASFDNAARALHDDDMMLLIASRITDNLIHLYMAVMNILIDGNDLKVTFKQFYAKQDARMVVVSIRGETDAFEFWIRRFGTIVKKFPQENGSSLYRIEIEDGANIPIGYVVIDEAPFEVLDVMPMQSGT